VTPSKPPESITAQWPMVVVYGVAEQGAAISKIFNIKKVLRIGKPNNILMIVQKHLRTITRNQEIVKPEVLAEVQINCRHIETTQNAL
jgi:hypothetical protein